jgi:hypothetical protein
METPESSQRISFRTKATKPKETVPKEVKSNRSSNSEKKTKIGTFASAEFKNWLNTPIQKPKIKRSKKTNDDAYQVFQDFSDMVDNPDWKTFFQKLYTGKFPHGYSYRNQTLFFRKRTKIEKLEIIDCNRSMLHKVMNFFTTYGGYSNSDDDLNIFDYMVSQTPNYNSWKDIRSKKSKQFFIMKYIDRLSQTYDLTTVERKRLQDTIHIGFLIKTIDTPDIEFEDNKIMTIKTLSWNPEKREFTVPKISKTAKTNRKPVSEKVCKNSFGAHWVRFISNIVKDKKNTLDEDISTDVSTAIDDLTDTTVSYSVISE